MRVIVVFIVSLWLACAPAGAAERPVGIIAPMDEEMAGYMAELREVRTERIAGETYYSGRLRGVPVVVCRCGVGKVNAAVHTQAMIDRYGPMLIIQSGIAGGLSPKVRHFDLVVASDLTYSDMQEFILKGFDSLKPAYLVDGRLVALVRELLPEAHVGRIATGDVFVDDAGLKRDIAGRTGALCVEMEGCAVAHAATLSGVPFIVLRTISDLAESGITEDYATFKDRAAKRSSQVVMDLIVKLADVVAGWR